MEKFRKKTITEKLEEEKSHRKTAEDEVKKLSKYNNF